MGNESPNNYLFLNREGHWPNFERFGLEIVDGGTLQLSSLPRLSAALPDSVKQAPTPDGPAGIAIDHDGNLYFTEPDSNALNMIQACDARLGPFPCMRGGTSGAAGSLNNPRGLLIAPNRNVLLVADSGNNRIQIFDLSTYQLLEIWGASAPQPGSQSGSFNTPWTIAADEAGNVYVVDYGNKRVQKFNFLGDVAASFEQNVTASGELQQPVDLALRTVGGKTQIFIADSVSAKISVFDEAGNPVKDAQGNNWQLADGNLTKPSGLAIAGDALFVGDNAARKILRFQIGEKFAFVDDAIGYDAPVAALYLDNKNNLWVHPGDPLTPISLATAAGHATIGAVWTKCPVTVGREVAWHRLQALLQPLTQNAHLDLFACIAEKPTPPPPVDITNPNPFSDERWHSFATLANIDLTDIYLGG